MAKKANNTRGPETTDVAPNIPKLKRQDVFAGYFLSITNRSGVNLKVL